MLLSICAVNFFLGVPARPVTLFPPATTPELVVRVVLDAHTPYSAASPGSPS